MMKEIKVEKLSETEAKVLYDNMVISKRIITKQRDDSDRMSFHHVVIKAGWEHPVSYDEEDEIIYFLDGKATISWDGKEVEVSAGSCVYVPSGCEYRYQGKEDATMVCVFSPPAE
jgi:mannose-6-phosphate isomerase-like protein (cupin superfamily)